MSKTLYIGLGGLGGRVVLNAKQKEESLLSPDRQDLFFIVDRDPYDCEDLYQGALPFLPLHSEKRIKDYPTDCGGSDVLNWLPTSPQILHTLAFQAPQRAAGRLTFLDAVQNGRLRPLEEMLDKALSDPLATELKIVIVTGLAGATGSGIFIQAALWLRKLLRQKTDLPCKIFGILVGPEGCIAGYLAQNPREQMRLRTNTHAALKELELINGIATGTNPHSELALDGILKYAAKLETAVFDQAFVYDLALDHKNAPNFADFIEQIAGAVLSRFLNLPLPQGSVSSYSDPFQCPAMTCDAYKEAYRNSCNIALQTNNEGYVPHIDKRWITLWN